MSNGLGSMYPADDVLVRENLASREMIVVVERRAYI